MSAKCEELQESPLQRALAVQDEEWQCNVLLQVEGFVDKVLDSEEKAYCIGRSGKLVKASKLADHLEMFFSSLTVFEQGRKYNAYVMLYFETIQAIWKFTPCRWSANDEVPGTGLLAGEIFNSVITRIRKSAEGKKFKMEAKALRKAVRRREKEYFAYVDDLFRVYSRLMVVRVDLSYIQTNEKDKPDGSPAETQKLHADLQHLLNNMKHKRSLFEHLAGYVLKLESGRDRGAHAHFLLFFDGAYVRKDIWYAEQVGRYWCDTITQGRGSYWNCNSQKARYKRQAVGMIKYCDNDLRENLKLVISYLCKTDQVIERSVGSKMKGMRRGATPKNSSKAGRPRHFEPIDVGKIGSTHQIPRLQHSGIATDLELA